MDAAKRENLEARGWVVGSASEFLGLAPEGPAVLVGQAIGDALGMPFEERGNRHHPLLFSWDKTSYLPGTWHKLPPGHWTDDTEMAEALSLSLLETKGHFCPHRTGTRYLAWAQSTPHGMGSTTKKAMDRLGAGCLATQSGEEITEPPVGSGTAMRAAPLGVVYQYAPLEVLRMVCEQDACITHVHPDATAGSVAVAYGVQALRKDPTLQHSALLECIVAVLPASRVRTALITVIQLLAEKQPLLAICESLGGFGEVASLVPTALTCAALSTSFLDGVCNAILIGGDTDTRAAITGALEGARRGVSGIPAWCLTGLYKAAQLQSLDLALEDVAQVHRKVQIT